MTVEPGEGFGPVFRRPGEDAVSRVRRALDRAHSGSPLYPGEQKETKAAVAELRARLARLKAMGVEFAEVDLSVYVRQLDAGSGPMTMAS